MSSAYDPTRFFPVPAWSPPAAGRHRRRGRPRRGDFLASLVDALDREVPDDADPVAFALFGPDAAEAFPGSPLYELDAADLLGWRAPDGVVAVAVVAWGRAHSLVDAPGRARSGGTLDQAGGDPSAGGNPRAVGPVRVVAAVGRDGGVAGRFTLDGRVHEEAPAAGRLFDALRRSLGLATDPPPVTTLPLVTNLWLSAVLGESARLGRRLDWPEALRLHPAGTILADDPAGALVAASAATSEVALAAVAAKATELWDWETTRRVAADHGCLAELCPSELAGWMDEGMFARWVLDELLPLPALLDRVEAALTPEAAGSVRRAVRPDRSGAPG